MPSSTTLDTTMALVSLSAPLVCLAIPIARYRQGARKEAGALGLALIAAVVASVLLQFTLLRGRPDAPLFLAPPTPSFPSGHAALVGALFVFGTLVHRRWGLMLASYGALVGVSRVALHHHHPSDVLAGLAVGGSIGALVYGRLLAPRSPRPGWAWWLWPQLAGVVLASLAAYLDLLQLEFLRLPGLDKVLHFALFGALCFFLVGWLAPRPWTRVSLALAAVATADELAQAWFPMRSFDLVDLAFTLGGIGLFGWAAGATIRKRDRRSPRPHSRKRAPTVPPLPVA